MRKPDSGGRSSYLKPHGEALAELGMGLWSVSGSHSLTSTPSSKPHVQPSLSRAGSGLLLPSKGVAEGLVPPQIGLAGCAAQLFRRKMLLLAPALPAEDHRLRQGWCAEGPDSQVLSGVCGPSVHREEEGR